MKATAGECIRNGDDPELKGLYTWLNNCKSKNKKFLFTCVFTYCFGLDLFRKGVKRSNNQVILTAINKLSPLVYGFNKTQYMEIDLRHNITMDQCPDVVKQLICHALSLSQSDHPRKCECGDFILESKNKRPRMWLPSGAPTSGTMAESVPQSRQHGPNEEERIGWVKQLFNRRRFQVRIIKNYSRNIKQ